MSNNVITASSSQPDDMLRFAVINARSLRNKTAVFVDHIIDQNIDVCAVTETWLKDKDTASIADLLYVSRDIPLNHFPDHPTEWEEVQG